MFDTTIVINIYLSFLFPLEMQIPVIICLGHSSLLRCRTVRHILSLQKVIFEWMNETSNHSFYLHWLFFLSFFFFFWQFLWEAISSLSIIGFLGIFPLPSLFEALNLKCFSDTSYSLCDGSSHHPIFNSHHTPKFHFREAALNRWKFGDQETWNNI